MWPQESGVRQVPRLPDCQKSQRHTKRLFEPLGQLDQDPLKHVQKPTINIHVRELTFGKTEE